MKNLIEISTKVSCPGSCATGFLCKQTSCPCCEGYSDHQKFVCDFRPRPRPPPHPQQSDSTITYRLCKNCRIIFDNGCLHGANCYDRVYNAHFISKWKYRGEIYVGMPQFDTIDEWEKELKNIEISLDEDDMFLL